MFEQQSQEGLKIRQNPSVSLYNYSHLLMGSLGQVNPQEDFYHQEVIFDSFIKNLLMIDGQIVSNKKAVSKLNLKRTQPYLPQESLDLFPILRMKYG